MPRRIHWEDAQSLPSPSSSEDRDSINSSHSRSTVPTEYSYRPALQQSKSCHARVEPPVEDPYGFYTPQVSQKPVGPSASVDTYASTSSDDLDEDDDENAAKTGLAHHHVVPEYRQQESFPSEAIPTTPRDFGDLFPSAKRVSIRHDDSTIDGNMNLRIDTQVETRRGVKQTLTLFHLRMHDLKTRDFSLRRYCRDSGREVCHSIRKYQKPPPDRKPMLQRSFSNALATLRSNKNDGRPSTSSGLKRSDSGYESMHVMDSEGGEVDAPRSSTRAKTRARLPTNTIKLEFSNYAHVDVKRRGTKSKKRYSFEYWGVTYSWKRIVTKDGDTERYSYILCRADEEHQLAHIVPMQLSPAQAHEEAARGGWIPPCYLRIVDERIIEGGQDVADVVVSTGLMALVDDSIKNHFVSKQVTQLHIPLSGSSFNLEYLGPKRIIDEIFHRSNKAPPPALHPNIIRRQT